MRRDCTRCTATPCCYTSLGRSRTRLAAPSRSSPLSGEPAWPLSSRPNRCVRREGSSPHCDNLRRCRWTRWSWSPNLTGPPACVPPGTPAAPAPKPSYGASCAKASSLTLMAATGLISSGRRVSRRTCTSARSARAKCWHAVKRFAESQSISEQRSGAAGSSSLSWAGVSSPITCCSISRTRRSNPAGASSPGSPGGRTPRGSRAWQRGHTGYPSWTPACASSGPPAGCTTACAWWSRRSWSSTCWSPWQEGARWFWDTLVDADLANNTLGWQWSAGCGADAAPYLPDLQPGQPGREVRPGGQLRPPLGPELARLPDAWIHQPWQAPPATLTTAGVELGRTYPRPLVSHLVSREVALEAYRGLTL